MTRKSSADYECLWWAWMGAGKPRSWSGWEKARKRTVCPAPLSASTASPSPLASHCSTFGMVKKCTLNTAFFSRNIFKLMEFYISVWNSHAQVCRDILNYREQTWKPRFSIWSTKMTCCGIQSSETHTHTHTLSILIWSCITSSKIVSIILFVVGGSELCRKYWKEFVKNIHVIVWLVDSSATEERLQENSAVLKEFLDQPVTENIPVLFVANKQVRVWRFDRWEFWNLFNPVWHCLISAVGIWFENYIFIFFFFTNCIYQYGWKKSREFFPLWNSKMLYILF